MGKQVFGKTRLVLELLDFLDLNAGFSIYVFIWQLKYAANILPLKQTLM